MSSGAAKTRPASQESANLATRADSDSLSHRIDAMERNLTVRLDAVNHRLDRIVSHSRKV